MFYKTAETLGESPPRRNTLSRTAGEVNILEWQVSTRHLQDQTFRNQPVLLFSKSFFPVFCDISVQTFYLQRMNINDFQGDLTDTSPLKQNHWNQPRHCWEAIPGTWALAGHGKILKAVLLVQPMYRLGHFENYYLFLWTIIFIRSKFPKNVWLWCFDLTTDSLRGGLSFRARHPTLSDSDKRHNGRHGSTKIVCYIEDSILRSFAWLDLTVWGVEVSKKFLNHSLYGWLGVSWFVIAKFICDKVSLPPQHQ